MSHHCSICNCRIFVLVIVFQAGQGLVAIANSPDELSKQGNGAEMNIHFESAEVPVNPSVEQQEYGTTESGDPVTLFVCTNSQGNSMSLIDYGATMVSLMMPDRNGNRANIILTCNDIESWQQCQSYFGCVAGRYCNRIAAGKFTLNNTTWELAVNNGPNHLHGGLRGFDKVMWKAEPLSSDDSVGIRFSRVSPDGEEGYPGTLTAIAEYRLNNNNELVIEFRARTDQATHVNLTNHNYWNLAGHDSGTHLEQELKVEADHYLESDETLIPTGNMLDVVEGPLDFREFRKIGERLDKVGGDVKGYDHCFAVRDYDGSMRPVATVRDPASGRVMEIHSTQPGLQFYTGNYLDGGPGSGGYPQYAGYCLETQHYPDTPNQDGFPTTRLEPGEEFLETTVCKFTVQ